MQGSQDFIRRRCQCLSGIIKSYATAAADDDDGALSYDLRSVRPVRSGNMVVTLSFASMIFTGKQEGIRWPSPRCAGPAKRSCKPASA